MAKKRKIAPIGNSAKKPSVPAQDKQIAFTDIPELTEQPLRLKKG